MFKRNKVYIIYWVLFLVGLATSIYFVFSYISTNTLNNIEKIHINNIIKKNTWNWNNQIDLLQKKSDKNNWKIWNKSNEINNKSNNTNSNIDLLRNENTWITSFNNIKTTDIKNLSANKKNIYIAINWLDKSQFKILSNYLKKAKLLLSSKYTFHIIYSKNIDREKSCMYWYKSTKLSNSLSPFYNSKVIIYWELIKYFNKYKISSNDKLLILNNNSLNINCNNLNTIKDDISKITRKNNNILILSLSDTEKLKENFIYQLSIMTWTIPINFANDLDLRNKLNDYIYPIENKLQLNKWKTANWDINTYIDILDKHLQPYQAKITVFKKEWSVFKPISDKEVSKAYTNSLDAWIYKFLAYDPITDIYLETKEIVINKLNKFQYKFIFRKTKVIINIVDNKNLPILADIRIKWIERKNVTLNNYNQKSSLLLDLKPWTYVMSIKTKNNFIFNNTFKVNWEDNIIKKFKTIKQKVQVEIRDKDNALLKSMLITINKDWKLYDTKKWNNLLFNLQLWKYTVKAVDPISWNLITQYLAIDKITTYTKTIKLKMIAYPVYIDLWQRGIIIKIYNKEMLTKSLKTISWTWNKIINLSKWSYLLKVFDKSNKLLYNDTFSVDDFLKNTIKIKEDN